MTNYCSIGHINCFIIKFLKSISNIEIVVVLCNFQQFKIATLPKVSINETYYTQKVDSFVCLFDNFWSSLHPYLFLTSINTFLPPKRCIFCRDKWVRKEKKGLNI